MRVCDALLFRRGLPLYPVPPAGQAPQGWEQWIAVGFALFAALAPLGLFRPDGAAAPCRAPSDAAALRFGRLCETYPDAVFCALLGHRPPPKRTPWGLQQRIAALRMQGRRRTPTAGCGTARSTSSTPAPRPTPPTRSPRAAACGWARRRRA